MSYVTVSKTVDIDLDIDLDEVDDLDLVGELEHRGFVVHDPADEETIFRFSEDEINYLSNILHKSDIGDIIGTELYRKFLK